MLVVNILIIGYFLYFQNKQNPTLKTQNLIATTTIDQFADWKTYRNEEYGFEFKYPENYEASFDNNNLYFRIDKIEIKNEKEEIKSDKFFIEMVWGDDIDYLPYIDKYKEDNLNGYKTYQGLRIDSNFSPYSGYDTYIIKKPDEVWLIAASFNTSEIETQKLINQILSTFKFTK